MTPDTALTLHDPMRPEKVIGTVEIGADQKAIVAVVRNGKLTHPSERYELDFQAQHETKTFVLIEVAGVKWEDR